MIVEDEILVALELEDIAEGAGCEVVGIAADAAEAHGLCQKGVDLALVDLNLRDGETGVDIAREVAGTGALVIFVTASEGLIEERVPGALGVLSKPVTGATVESAIAYALAVRNGTNDNRVPPPALRLFG